MTTQTIPQTEINAIHFFTAQSIRAAGWFRCAGCYRWRPQAKCAATWVIEHDDMLLPYALCGSCNPLVSGGDLATITRVRDYVVGEVAR